MSGLFKKRASAIAVAACILAQTPVGQALAQEAPVPNEEPNSPQDIVVTATRTPSSAGRVPISVAAFNTENLDKQNVRRVDDIARITPGLQLSRRSNLAGTSSSIAIRGIDSTVGAATTGVYIDDTPIQSRTLGNTATNSYPLIFDLDRVEVLRGPQGTLFGASAEGGAVRFITPKPSLNGLSVNARAELSTTDSGGINYEGGVAVGAPIVEDRIGLRASAWYRHEGGWVDRVGPLTATGANTGNPEKNVNSSNSQAYRLAIGFAPSDVLTITPSVYYQVARIADSSNYYRSISDPDNQRYATANQIPADIKDRFVLPALLVELDAGAFEVVSNTSYFDRRFTTNVDYTYLDSETFSSRLPYITLPGQSATGHFVNTQKTFSQELRLQSTGTGPLSWVVGGFYSRSKQLQFQDIVDPYLPQLLSIRTGLPNAVEATYRTPMLPGDVFFRTNIDSVDKQLSGFAELTYRLTDELKVTAGARISRTTFAADILREGPLAGGRSLISRKQSETPITPKFNISWQPDPSLLIYATAAKGFRPGGGQAQLSPVACAADFAATGVTETPAAFNSDSLWSYEIGAKKREGVISIDASAYLIKWKNIQQNVYFRTCGGSFIANTGTVTSRGFDVAVNARPAEGLQIGLSMGYTLADFDDNVFSTPTSLLKTKGSRLPIPPLSLTVNAEYEFAVSDKNNMYVRGDYQYVASQLRPAATDYAYDPANQLLPVISNLDLRVGFRSGPLDVAIFGTNMFNNAPIQEVHGSPTSPLFSGIAPRPRVIGVNGSVRF